jgi:murein DD-endopeptidase MepM/ murein hydrolase activator NlpD
VVIRHVDGTASAYAHLKHNEVFFKGGDSVK